MRARDYVEEIVWSFRKQKLRTALTSFGIGIGAFAIAIMVGLGQGVQSYIEEQVRAFGNPRVVMVFPDLGIREADRAMNMISSLGRPAQKIDRSYDEDKRTRRAGFSITKAQVEKLRALDGVERVAPLTGFDLDGIALGDLPESDTRPADLYETDMGALATHPFMGKPAPGRAPKDDAAEVVLSPQYAKAFGLAPEALLGREVGLWVPKLEGVQMFMFRDPAKFKDEHRLFRARVVGLGEASPMSRAVYASLSLGTEMFRYQSGNPDILSDDKAGRQLSVRFAESADPRKVKKEIKEIGLIVKGMDEQLADVSRTFLVFKMALSLFGLIAVLVATLGIANTLLMAISERTREIGVMKALGATEATIRRMFAAEAAAIGFVGGIAGTLAAIGLGAVLNVVARRYLAAESFVEFTAFAFPVWLILGAVAFSTAIGALAGLYPANRAARLDPIEAIRYE